MVGKPEVILGRALRGDLYDVSERKSTVFRSRKLCVLSFSLWLSVAFLTRGFPFIPGALRGPSRSRPSGLRRSVAGCALTPSTPASSRYLLRLFLTLARLFFAAFAFAALPAADKTRFFTPTTSRSAEPPNAFAEPRVERKLHHRLAQCTVRA
jgi:hypothetical protein